MKNHLIRPILAVLILFIPLYPKFPLASVSGTYVAIRLDDIVVALSLLAWLLYQLTHHLPVLKFKINVLFIAYFLAIITSALTAILIYQTDSPHLLLLNLFRRFEYISLFYIAATAIQNKKDLHFPYTFLLITMVLVSLYGYGQKYFHFPVISTMNAEFSKGQLLQMNIWTRISSTFAGHYDLAAFLSVALILILGISVTQKKLSAKIVPLLIWLAGFHILTLTASRISIFAFWGGAVLVLFFLRKYLYIVPVSLLVISSFFGSKDLNQRLIATLPNFKFLPQISLPTSIPTPTATPQIAIPTSPQGHTTPIPTVFRHGPIEEVIPIDVDAGVARSGEIRFNAEWPRAVNAFRKNPISGTGLGSITLATDNDYLRLLGESGLFGFTTFMILIGYFFFKSFRSKNQLNHIFAVCLLTMLANAIFIDVFEASKTAYLFWLMMGIYYRSLEFKK